MRPALSALLVLPLVAFASASGISGYSTKTAGMNCTACHSGGTVPSSSISGAPIALNVNTPVTVTVTVTAGATASTVAGLDVALGGAASADSVLIAGADTKVLAGELTHMAPKRFDGGIATFTFQVRAGAINGPLTLYMATLAGNGNNLSTLDSYYGFNRTITVQGDAGQPVPDSGVIVDPDSGVVIIPDAGEPDAGPVTQFRPGGFVGGEYGCSTGGGFPSGAWMLLLGLVGLALRRKR
jgi:MYXO-CTERM domain-containing protein